MSQFLTASLWTCPANGPAIDPTFDVGVRLLFGAQGSVLAGIATGAPAIAQVSCGYVFSFLHLSLTVPWHREPLDEFPC